MNHFDMYNYTSPQRRKKLIKKRVINQFYEEILSYCERFSCYNELHNGIPWPLYKVSQKQLSWTNYICAFNVFSSIYGVDFWEKIIYEQK